MLYTVVPMEIVYPSELPRAEEEVRGGARLIWQTGSGGRRLIRVVSTDLRDYLRYRI